MRAEAHERLVFSRFAGLSLGRLLPRLEFETQMRPYPRSPNHFNLSTPSLRHAQPGAGAVVRVARAERPRAGRGHSNAGVGSAVDDERRAVRGAFLCFSQWGLT